MYRNPLWKVGFRVVCELSYVIEMNLFFSITQFQFGETLYQGGGQFGPILRPQLEFVIVHSGGASVIVDGDAHRLIEGYAALVLSRRRLLYSYREDRDTRVSWCEATEGLPPALSVPGLRSFPLALPVSRRMLELQKIGVDLGDDAGLAIDALRRALGVAVCQEFLYQARRLRSDRPIHQAVRRAKEFIDGNFSQPCDLTGLANVAHVSPQYLIKLFKKEFSRTPIQYLWSVRAHKGAQLLRRSGLSVAAISYRCGYENPNHFSRHIKEQFGITATELRRRCWQEPTRPG